jgi:hypothetical protein
LTILLNYVIIIKKKGEQMSLVTLSYLIDLYVGFSNLLVLTTIFSFMTMILVYPMMHMLLDSYFDDYDKAKKITQFYGPKIMKISAIVFLLTVLINFFLPSQRTVYLYFGEKYSSEIIKNNPIVEKTYKLIIKKLDEELGEK